MNPEDDPIMHNLSHVIGRNYEPDGVFDGVKVPFTAHGDASDRNMNKGIRVREVREFIGMDVGTLKTLDIGAPNAFGQILGMKDNTEGDVNEGVRAPSADYDLILFSEILEHLMNPLGAVRDCYRLLKPGGILIVSTPIMAWHTGIIFQSPHHFTEYRPDRLKRLFEHVGFEIVAYRKIHIWDWKFAFYGIRPFLRVLLHRSQLWKLRRPE